MALSNTKQYMNNPKIVSYEADKNYTKYTKCIDMFNELGQNNIILTNINDMDKKRKKLLENGSITEEDFTYSLLMKTINEAHTLYSKSIKSVEDVINFYNIYRNFNDICNKIGDEYV